MPRLMLRLLLLLPLPPPRLLKEIVMDWKWKQLIVALVGAILGWLSSIVVPAPGTQKIVPVQQIESKRIPG